MFGNFATLRSMTPLENTLERVRKRAALDGITPQNLVRRITGDPTLYVRMVRRVEKTAATVQRIDAWLSENPTQEAAE